MSSPTSKSFFNLNSTDKTKLLRAIAPAKREFVKLYLKLGYDNIVNHIITSLEASAELDSVVGLVISTCDALNIDLFASMDCSMPTYRQTKAERKAARIVAKEANALRRNLAKAQADDAYMYPNEEVEGTRYLLRYGVHTYSVVAEMPNGTMVSFYISESSLRNYPHLTRELKKGEEFEISKEAADDIRVTEDLEAAITQPYKNDDDKSPVPVVGWRGDMTSLEYLTALEEEEDEHRPPHHRRTVGFRQPESEDATWNKLTGVNAKNEKVLKLLGEIAATGKPRQKPVGSSIRVPKNTLCCYYKPPKATKNLAARYPTLVTAYAQRKYGDTKPMTVSYETGKSWKEAKLPKDVKPNMLLDRKELGIK